MENPDKNIAQQMTVAIAQCLSWGGSANIDTNINQLQSVAPILQSPFEALPRKEDLEQFIAANLGLWEAKIGLVYGGATKIKQYVFESADLQEIRGASALLDRINLIDLPAFFQGETSDHFPECQKAKIYCEKLRSDHEKPGSGWLETHFPNLVGALTPEMIVYSTGGNILAFCPAALVDDLTDAIEKRYVTETLTANACAVGTTVSPVEIYLGLLTETVENTLWLDSIKTHKDNLAAQAYFSFAANATTEDIEKAFRERKGFSELVGKLANQFNQRRSGYSSPKSSRPSRRFPPNFETHPYLMRDDSDRRSAVAQASLLPDTPHFSEPTARKRRVGQITKRDKKISGQWYIDAKFQELWDPLEHTRGIEDAEFRSWISKFESFLSDQQKGYLVGNYDSERKLFDHKDDVREIHRREARSLTEIGSASNGYVAYIYADGNNMGAYIRDQIKTPEQYQQFSQDVFEATVQSVYWALAHCVKPHYYTPDAKSSRDNKSPVWIHPFEIIAIGGDDVLLIVPANTALAVAQKIGEKFEEILAQTGRYALESKDTKDSTACHRYQSSTAKTSQSRLSISSGVLITAENTPIYYADKLVSQLLKSAKKKAKDLREQGYFGGTVDFLTLKAVTMISSNIESFRSEGLTVRFSERQQELKLYAAPYTLHELGGLIDTVRAVKKSKFPRSQLYQIRSLLEQGKRTAMLNYRYFRIRLGKDEQRLLEGNFEAAWCEAETNRGNLAPWLTAVRKPNKTIYETLWRELVELYDFIQIPEDELESQAEVSQIIQDREASS
ncbi:type III-B CRISPR-associated protein Cas10/Cmr2 [Acaryochloris marina NIES-2412]|uniref:type III-B CRISPR-associated protein Cas10/Cmr2 n=1 Tax=Acaryochloris marina TaxID=155978 RepID=UPI0040592A3C